MQRGLSRTDILLRFFQFKGRCLLVLMHRWRSRSWPDMDLDLHALLRSLSTTFISCLSGTPSITRWVSVWPVFGLEQAPRGIKIHGSSPGPRHKPSSTANFHPSFSWNVNVQDKAECGQRLSAVRSAHYINSYKLRILYSRGNY